MPHLDIDGVKFHYQQAGGGPDVVLVHAATANLSVWVFMGLMDALSKDYRVTAYDLRGHGHTDAPPAGYTSADMADDFHRLHAALRLGPAVLVGHSYGAVVALHAASRSPDVVRGVILSDAYFPGLARVEPNLHKANVWVELRESFAAAGVDVQPGADFTPLFRAVASLTEGQKDKLKDTMGLGAFRWLSQLPRLAETTCGKDMFDQAGFDEAAIAAVKQPVVALYDEFSPFSATRDFLSESLADCTVETVPQAKHLAPLENPQAFTALVQKHLRRIITPPPRGAGTRTTHPHPHST